MTSTRESLAALPTHGSPPASTRDKQLKVLLVINGLGTGGTQRSLAEMLPTLLQNDIIPAFACLKPQREGVESLIKDQGFAVHFLHAKTMAGRILELRKLIREETPDLIHTSIFESDMAGRLASIGLKTPVLTSLVHTPYDPVRRLDPKVKPIRMHVVKLLDGWTSRHLVNHFHAVTHAVKASAVAALKIPQERITVIERGRDPIRLGNPSDGRRQRARSELGLGHKDEVLINVGRQEFQKGQRFLVEAVSVLAPSRPQLVALIAGRRGNSSDELERMVREHRLGDKVRFLGHRDDVPDLLAAADVFVFPSLYEGIGGAMIEAMALGLPIVTSDLETLREVVDPNENAVLVPPTSPKQLASAIASLLDDKDMRSRFGKRSLEIFAERYSGDRHGHRMAELYRQIADSADRTTVAWSN